MDRHLKTYLYDIATRNRVIHDYAAVTDDVMWKIVINDLPKLKKEVSALLAAEDSGNSSVGSI